MLTCVIFCDGDCTKILNNSRLGRQYLKMMNDIMAAQRQRALTYENAGVVERITIETGRTETEAVLLFKDTLRFLWVASVSDGPVSPPKAIDEGWHSFLLFTKDYVAFCHEYLGRVVHHCPHTATMKKEPDFKSRAQKSRVRTFVVFRREFGDSLPANWKSSTSVCSADCDGSSDDSCDDSCEDCSAECGGP